MKIYEYIVRIKDQASDKVRKLGSSISNGVRGMNRYSDSVNRAEKSTNSLGNASSFLSRYIGPAVLGAALLSAGTFASKLAMKMESTKISFEVMLHSADRASTMLAEITDMANVTPFTRNELQDSAKLLLNFGVDARKILPTLKMLGDISGGNSDRLYHLSLAFAQSSAAGRLMGQDLLQMVNAGFNPLQEISKKTGLSLVKLKERMEDGAISTKMVEAAFKSATEEGGQFFGMMDRQSQTFEGRLSTLKDKSEIWAGQIGSQLNEAFSPILDRVISKVDELIDKVGSIKTKNDLDVKSIRTLTTQTAPLVDRYDQLIQKKKKLGLTPAEEQEIVGSFQKLTKAIPFANVYDKATGAIKDFDVSNARYFVDLQKDQFESDVDSRIASLTDEKNKIDAHMKGEDYGAWEKTKNFGSTIRRAPTIDELQKMSAEKNRILGLIDELKSTKQNAFKSLSPDATEDTGNPYADLMTDKKKKKKGRNGLDNITGGGKQAVNVTINLENLVGVQNFDVTNVKESVQDMKKVLVEGLLEVLNSANYAAAQ